MHTGEYAAPPQPLLCPWCHRANRPPDAWLCVECQAAKDASQYANRAERRAAQRQARKKGK